MSQENVDLVRSAIAAYDSGEDMTDYLHPGIVWNPVEEEPSEGIDAVFSYMERWTGEWDNYSHEVEDMLDAGDSVVVTIHFTGRGRSSGIDVDTRLYEVWRVRSGKVTRMDEYSDPNEAREAAGLPE